MNDRKGAVNSTGTAQNVFSPVAMVGTENPEVTGSGAIWGGGRSFLSLTTGIVESEGAIWGGRSYCK